MKTKPTQPMNDEVKDEEDILIISLRLKSNRFESTIQIPLFAPDEQKKDFVEAWLNLMEMGLKCSPKGKV